MHPLCEYISRQLVNHLKKRRIVVWYDPHSDFRSFIRELHGGSDPMGCMLESVKIGEVDASLCVFQGSYFEVKFVVEPHVCVDMPDPLLIYVPAAKLPRSDSLLLELEKAGDSYEPQLKRLARNVLRERYSDGQIDKMLEGERSYDDIAEFLKSDSPQRSMLKVIFEGAYGNNAALLADWIARADTDAKIVEKSAKGELLELIKSRLGLQLDEDLDLGDARTQTARYVLIGEFRDDFEGEPPPAVAMIPKPSSKDHVRLVRDVAQAMRLRHGDAYPVFADQVEQEFGLGSAAIPPAQLGKIDTFRFEERTLLLYVGQLIADRKFSEARKVVNEHRRSFWTDLDIRRQNQWEACRLMAELGSLAMAIRKDFPAKGSSPQVWIDGYTAEDGWYRLDFTQRNLEAVIATMTEDTECEKALSLVRSDYEQTLGQMTKGFIAAQEHAHWTVANSFGQTQVYSDLVDGAGPVAYFLIDSMRYEMGVELSEQLNDADEVVLQSAVAVAPTITPICMAALLPSASASFNVREEGGKLAAEIDGKALKDWPARKKYLQARVPGMTELEMSKLLDMTTHQAKKKIDDAPLVVVRSTEIDYLGETSSNHLARQVVDTAIGNVARAVRKLSSLGIERFVIAADHGHLFASVKEESSRIDSPGGDKIELHRRCWVGRGGTTPKGTVRVNGADLGYQTDLDFVFPTGIGVFKAGGDLAYHHGGMSLQEMLIPVLTVRMVREKTKQTSPAEVTLTKLPDRITNRTLGVTITAAGDLFGDELIAVRPVMLHGGVQVGEAGMVLDAEFDQRTRCVELRPNTPASVAMILQSEDCDKVRIVVLDPKTDKVLAQSDEIPVKLGI
ncbi:MAG: PglZ domain-containing protein [Phycisphaerales bacterium]|nr:PglZ domain-containing protein [Phycisphaerales bacterium]